MTGNVMEFCRDGYGSYTADAATDLTGAYSNSKVLRGGYFGGYGGDVRATTRWQLYYTSANYYTGFRIALYQ